MVTWSWTKKPKSPTAQRTAFSTNKWWCLKWQWACRRLQIDPFLSPCTKLKSKWIKDLHIKPNTLKLIEEKVGKGLEYISTGLKFLNRTTIAYALRSRIIKGYCVKLHRFSKVKETVNWTKWQPRDWKKIFPYPTSDRGLISNIDKELM